MHMLTHILIVHLSPGLQRAWAWGILRTGTQHYVRALLCAILTERCHATDLGQRVVLNEN